MVRSRGSTPPTPPGTILSGSAERQPWEIPARTRSRMKKVVKSVKAMRFNPSPEQSAQLSEQIHLCGLERLDLQRGSGGGHSVIGFGSVGMAVEKLLQLLEVFLQRFQ